VLRRVGSLEIAVTKHLQDYDRSVPGRVQELEQRLEGYSAVARAKQPSGSSGELDQQLNEQFAHISRLNGEVREARAALNGLAELQKKGNVDPEAFAAAVRALHSKAERNEVASLKDAMGQIKRYLRDHLTLAGAVEETDGALLGGKCLSCDRTTTKFATLNQVDLALEKQKRDLLAQVQHAMTDAKSSGEFQVVTVRNGRAASRHGLATREKTAEPGSRDYIRREVEMMMVGGGGGLPKSGSQPVLKRRGVDKAFQTFSNGFGL